MMMKLNTKKVQSALADLAIVAGFTVRPSPFAQATLENLSDSCNRWRVARFSNAQ